MYFYKNRYANSLTPVRKLQIIFVVLMLLTILSGFSYSCDGVSYFSAWQVIKDGRPDILRTPLYPVFIGVLQDIFTEEYTLQAVCLCQYLIFFVTIKYFYRTAEMIIRPGKIPFALTLLYIISPTTSAWCSVILTESLSISFIVIWVYTLAANWCKVPDWKTSILSAVMLFMLYMIRPSFLYLLPVSIIYMIACCKKWGKKHIKTTLVAVVLPALMLGAYIGVYKSAYGIYNVTCVHLVNQYHIMYDGDSADVSMIEDPGLRSAIIEYNESDTDYVTSFYRLVESQGLDKLEKSLVGVNTSDHTLLAKNFIRHLYKMSVSYDSTGYMINPPFFFVTRLLALDGKMYLLSLLIFTIWIIAEMCSGRRYALHMVLYLIVAGCIVTSTIGADAEFTRLSAPCVPVIFLMYGLVLSPLTLRRQS